MCSLLLSWGLLTVCENLLTKPIHEHINICIRRVRVILLLYYNGVILPLLLGYRFYSNSLFTGTRTADGPHNVRLITNGLKNGVV